MSYTPRLKAEDFGLSVPLNQAEKEFVVNQMWLHLSEQQFHIDQSKFDNGDEILQLIYGYLYGFSDGYLQQFDECDWLEFRGLLDELNLKLFERQIAIQGEELLAALDFESAANFDEEGALFLNAVNLGGQDGIIAATGKNTALTGLSKLFKPRKHSNFKPGAENEFAYELGSKLGVAIQATKQLPIFDKLLPENPKSRLSDDDLFERALDEVQNKKMVKAVWARALSESDGNEKKAEALYLKLRVQQIKDKKLLSAQKKRAEKKAEHKKKLEQERAELERETRKEAEVAHLKRLEQERHQLEMERQEQERFDSLPEKSFPIFNILLFILFVALFFFAAHLLIEYGKSL